MFEIICVLFNHFFRVDKALEKGNSVNETELQALWEELGAVWEKLFALSASSSKKRLLIWEFMDRLSYKRALLHRALCNTTLAPVSEHWKSYEEMCLKGAIYWMALLREEQGLS